MHKGGRGDAGISEQMQDYLKCRYFLSFFRDLREYRCESVCESVI